MITMYSDIDKMEALNACFSSNTYSLSSGSLSNIFIDEQEVVDIITILVVNKAIDPDCNSHEMLKSTECTVPSMLFNRSLSEDMFLSFRNIAHVIALFVMEDPSIVSNYRGMSCCYHALVKSW